MKQYEKCKQYKVNNVKTVEEVLDKYMIQEKWNTMSQELKDNIIRSHKRDLKYFRFKISSISLNVAEATINLFIKCTMNVAIAKSITMVYNFLCLFLRICESPLYIY